MAWQLPGNYTVVELIDIAADGWSGVLDSYLSPFTWVWATVTILVIVGLGIALMAKTKSAWGGLAFVGLGVPLSLFSWWQLYYAVIAGLAWPFLLLFILLVGAVLKQGVWMAVPVGLLIALLAGLWWLYPDWFLPFSFF